jgi:tyrosinase
MAATTVVSRENIESWPADSPKLLLFRKAVAAMQAISDDAVMDERGYQWEAGVHGGFGGTPFCHHGDDHFLTWHRPYLLDIELKLRARIADFAGKPAADEWRLPYWDWAAPGAAGIPDAFTAETYEEDGQERPNPLFSQPYQLPFGVDVDPPTDRTWRDAGTAQQLQAIGELVAPALLESDFHAFSTLIENPHNRIHGWAGGFMATYRSAFDPVFWCHHATIDRQFWMWQQGAGHMASIPRAVRELPCQPFKFKDIRAQAFFETRDLGYTYATERLLVTRDDAAARAASLEDPLAPLSLDFGAVPASFERARVNVHGVHHPEQTCELVFFANRATAPEATTPRTTDEGYLGSYMLLGHGPCPGAPGHCDTTAPVVGAALRPPHHLAPFDIFIDITATLPALAGNAPIDLAARMIVIDHTGVQLPTATVVFDNASLTFR